MIRRLLLCLAVLALTAPAARGDWPQFRGPAGDGHATLADLPLTWSEDQNVTWKIALPGRGHSSPVAADGKIWLTTALEESRSLRVLGIDGKRGEILHDVEVFRPTAWQTSHPDNSYASPTPVVADGRVFVHFGSYGTACLDAADARILWTSTELDLDHEVGPGSSPIRWENLLIVHADGTDQRYVMALDAATGELVWKAPRSLELGKKGSHLKAFSTPLVVSHAGQPRLISPAAGQVSAYDPATGEEIWRVAYEGYSNVPRPVAGLGMVFVNTGYIKPHLLAIRLGGRGDVTDSHVVWRYHWQVPANPSPILVGGRLFLISDQGRATWLDARKGEDLWRQRLGGRFTASPIYSRGRIYSFGLGGETWVIAASDEYRQLAYNTLEGSIRASPAVLGNAFVIRTESHLYRIENAARHLAGE